MTVRELVDAGELEELVGGELPVMIGFVAQACGPCLQQRPVWDELSRTQAEDLVVVLVDVDRVPALREAYGVQGLPTTALVVDGQLRELQSGLRTTRMLLELLGQPAS
ncbi:MAG: thioredoxin [Frankiales bacterium]|nr:thioredoxin [Frankiales bacterium]